jgi:hypothetical protein
MIDFSRWDLADLAAKWRDAKPFSHVIVDGLLPADRVDAMVQAAGSEPFFPNRGEIYEFFGSEQPVHEPDLAAFAEALGSPAGLAAVGTISGLGLDRAEARAYVYKPGHYLLPHLDHQQTLQRKVAYAYYLLVPEDGQGGELELFDVELRGKTIVAAKPSVRIKPQPNRIVLFEVSERSLHQVRETLAGTRLSMAGWFY